jgi:peptidoglycan/xylan/chitin deacetylase (PgdA/CDA1 family)
MSLARSEAVKSGRIGKGLARRIRTPWIVAAALAVVLAACVPPPPPTGGTLYLTFDDGPSVHTPQILSVLAANGAPATFFVVGEHAAQFRASCNKNTPTVTGSGTTPGVTRT